MPQRQDSGSPVILGAFGYTPTTEQTGRVNDFLRTFPARRRIGQVVIIPSENFQEAQRKFGFPIGKVAFTLPLDRRTYITSNLFEEPDPNKGVEWALAHEIGHLNDSRPYWQQESHDAEIDQASRDNLGRWLRDPRAGAYRKLQGIARQAFRGVEPEPSPIVPLAEQAAPRRSRLPLQVQPIRER